MKNKICLLSFSALAALLISGCSITIGEESQGPAEITSVEARRVGMYTSPVANAAPIATLNIFHFNGSPVGYLEANYFVSQLTTRYTNYTFKYDNFNFVITNNYTFAKCTIDFYHQTFTYSDYDAYNCTEADFVPYQDYLISAGKGYFVSAYSTSKYTKNADSYVVDLKDYNIPLYFYNEQGYIPVDLYLKYVTPFLDYTLSYSGTALYTCNMAAGGLSAIKAYKNNGNIFTKEYMEYTYNLLALHLDTNFGLDSRQRRDTNETFNFLEGGAYEVLKPYHDGLTSLEPNVADSEYMKFFSEQIDDGGHTGFTGATCLCDENRPDTYYGPDLQSSWTTSGLLTPLRSNAGYDPSTIVYQQTGIENNGAKQCYSEIGDTAFVTFDTFSTPDSSFSLPININNYWQNTISLTAYSAAKIRSNANIKHVVVDLSLNGGGESVAENFIASWLCGGVTTKTKNSIQGTYSEQTHYADVDFDGVLTENDFLASNIDVYCITSRASFSCGNLLAFHLKELRNAKLIGARSGGGSCMVGMSFPTGLGTTYQISRNCQLGSNVSTSYDNFVSVENGVTPEWYPISYDTNDAAKFYDRTGLVAKINTTSLLIPS